MRREISVGTDGSQAATAALRWAADEATRRGSTVWVVHVVDGQTKHAMDAGRAVLERAGVVARSAAPDVRVVTQLRTGDVVTELLAEAATAGTLVLGSRGHGNVVGLMLGSVCLQVAGRTNGSVVVVRQVPGHEFGTVVVGFDGSDESRRALAYAFDEAVARRARLTVLFAWTVPMVTGYETGFVLDLDGLVRENEEMLEAELATWRDKHPDVDLTGRLRLGPAAAALCEASSAADLVVVGSRGRGTITSAVLGSVSHDVLLHARCPVAVVGRGR